MPTKLAACFCLLCVPVFGETKAEHALILSQADLPILEEDGNLGKMLREGVADGPEKLAAWGCGLAQEPKLIRKRLRVMSDALSWGAVGRGELAMVWLNVLLGVESREEFVRDPEMALIRAPLLQWAFHYPDPRWEKELMDQAFLASLKDGKWDGLEIALTALGTDEPGRAAVLRWMARHGLDKPAGIYGSFCSEVPKIGARKPERILSLMKEFGWLGRTSTGEWLGGPAGAQNGPCVTLVERVLFQKFNLDDRSFNRPERVADLIIADTTLPRTEAHLLAAVLRGRAGLADIVEAIELSPGPFRALAEARPAAAWRFFHCWFPSFEITPEMSPAVAGVLQLVKDKRLPELKALVENHLAHGFSVETSGRLTVEEMFAQAMSLDVSLALELADAYALFRTTEPYSETILNLLSSQESGPRSWCRFQVGLTQLPQGMRCQWSTGYRPYLRGPGVQREPYPEWRRATFADIAQSMAKLGQGLSSQEQGALILGFSQMFEHERLDPEQTEADLLAALDVVHGQPLLEDGLRLLGQSALFDCSNLETSEPLAQLWVDWLGRKDVLVQHRLALFSNRLSSPIFRLKSTGEYQGKRAFDKEAVGVALGSALEEYTHLEGEVVEPNLANLLRHVMVWKSLARGVAPKALALLSHRLDKVIPARPHERESSVAMHRSNLSKLTEYQPFGADTRRVQEDKVRALSDSTHVGSYYDLITLIRLGYYAEASSLLPPKGGWFVFSSYDSLPLGYVYDRELEQNLASWAVPRAGSPEVFHVMALCQIWPDGRDHPPRVKRDDRMRDLAERFAIEAPAEPLARLECLKHLVRFQEVRSLLNAEIEAEWRNAESGRREAGSPEVDPKFAALYPRYRPTLEGMRNQLFEAVVSADSGLGDYRSLLRLFRLNLSQVPLAQRGRVAKRDYPTWILSHQLLADICGQVLHGDNTQALKACPFMADLVRMSAEAPLDEAEQGRILFLCLLAHVQAGRVGDYVELLKGLPQKLKDELAAKPEVYAFERIITNLGWSIFSYGAEKKHEENEVLFFRRVLESDDLCGSLTPVLNPFLMLEKSGYEASLFAAVSEMDDAAPKKAAYLLQKGKLHQKLFWTKSLALADYLKAEQLFQKQKDGTGSSLAAFCKVSVLFELRRFTEAREALLTLRRAELSSKDQASLDQCLKNIEQAQADENE